MLSRSLPASLALLLLAFALIRSSASHAQTIPEACVEALATDGVRWDGPPMEPFTWDGEPVSLGDVDGMPVTLCRASGPPEILPMTQFIGCAVVGVTVARIGDEIGCGALSELRLELDGALLWVARSSAATNEVSRLPWSEGRFERGSSYVACWDDPYTPTVNPIDCGR